MPSQNLWNITASSTAGGVVSTNASAPLGAGMTNRLRSMEITANSTAIQNVLVALYSGTSTAGTSTALNIWPIQMGTAGNNTLTLSDMDIRVSSTTAMTIAFVTTLATAGVLAINAQGDVVQTGYPPFQI